MSQRSVPVLSFPLGLGVLFLLDFALFGDLLWPWGTRIISNGNADLAIHFIWWRQFGFDQMKAGNLPLWNPHYLCGTPFFGGFQAGLLYPLNWVHLFFPLPFAINLWVFLHVFLAGSFTYLWAWKRGLQPLACVIAGLAYMFGGGFFLHVFAGHLPNLGTMTWAPLIFLSLDQALGSRVLSGTLLGIFAVSMQVLAGHPQYLLYTGIMAAVYLVLNLPGSAAGWKSIGTFFMVYLGACSITAIQLWTGYQAFQECGRNVPLDPRSAASFPFPPQNLLTWWRPDLFGDPLKGHYWSQWYFWEGSLFMGCSVFVLCLFTLGKKSSRGTWVLWACATIALLLAFGAHTPLFMILYRTLPWFDGMRGIGKFSFLAGLFLALLGGIGMDRWMGSKEAPKTMALGVFLLGMLSLSLGSWVWISSGQGSTGGWGRFLVSMPWLRTSWGGLDPEVLDPMVRSAGKDTGGSLWMGAFLFLLIAGVLRTHRSLGRSWTWVLPVLVVLELIHFAGTYRTTFDPRGLWSKAASLRDFFTQNPGDYRVVGTGAASMRTGGFDLWEDEPMVLGRYGRFLCKTQGIPEGRLFSTSPLFKGFQDIYGMLRLRYRVAWGEDPIRIQPMPFKSLPRMFLASDWSVLPGEEAVWDRVLAKGFDPSKKVLLEKDPGFLPPKGPSQGKVAWKDQDTDTIEVWVETPRRALLVVTDNFAKGWEGQGSPDDPQRTYPVMPGNGLLRVVPLTEGRHHFVLVYAPSAFRVGKWVSLLSLLLYVGILLHFLRTRTFFRSIAP